VGSKRNRWMVLTNITRTLPMPRNLCETNKEQASVRHSLLQNKIEQKSDQNHYLKSIIDYLNKKFIVKIQDQIKMKLK
jgi:hypothetical protein